jgi:Mn2+/Fe2+ NRAMP family transporter
MEMCGRIAVVAGEPVFSVVRTRLGFPLGLATLIASNLLNLITCAAELGGVAIVLRLLTGWPEKLLLIGVTLAFGAMVFLFRFQWIERTLGLSGLMMIVFAVSAVALHPDWNHMLKGLLPTFSQPDECARSSVKRVRPSTWSSSMARRRLGWPMRHCSLPPQERPCS